MEILDHDDRLIQSLSLDEDDKDKFNAWSQRNIHSVIIPLVIAIFAFAFIQKMGPESINENITMTMTEKNSF